MRRVLLSLFALLLALSPAAAQNANPAEQFVSEQIRAGLAILNDSGLSAPARADKFESFLLGITDLKRVAVYTLGDAAATPAQRDVFVAAFDSYATAVYRSYFQRYSGQSLAVTGSADSGAAGTIVHTRLVDPQGGAPLLLDFRVRADGGKPLVLDIIIAGISLAKTQHDDFAAYLAHNHGDVDALTAHLAEVAKGYR